MLDRLNDRMLDGNFRNMTCLVTQVIESGIIASDILDHLYQRYYYEHPHNLLGLAYYLAGLGVISRIRRTIGDARTTEQLLRSGLAVGIMDPTCYDQATWNQFYYHKIRLSKSDYEAINDREKPIYKYYLGLESAQTQSSPIGLFQIGVSPVGLAQIK